MIAYSDTRYLAAKKTVDDRALNKDVVDRLRREIASINRARPRVLEVGAGLGTMVARLVDWGVLRQAEYLLLDVDAQTLAAARDWLAGWATMRGYSWTPSTEGIHVLGSSDGVELTVRTTQAELGAFLGSSSDPFSDPFSIDGPPPGPIPPRADVLIANAFLDLVDVPSTLPALLDLVAPEGLYWFSINYDGDTIFQPEHRDDEKFMAVYNRSMDERVRYGRPAGDCRTGRHLFQHLASAGASVLGAGSSDWVVYRSNGGYHADEAYFLHHIVGTIEQELRRHAEIDGRALADWSALRHAQIDAGNLIYLAHQMDFVGRCPAAVSPIRQPR